jgi:hypothetical protein
MEEQVMAKQLAVALAVHQAARMGKRVKPTTCDPKRQKECNR